MIDLPHVEVGLRVFAIEMNAKRAPEPGSAVQVRASVTTSRRDDPEFPGHGTVTVDRFATIDGATWDASQTKQLLLAQAVRSALLEIIEHELDEHIIVDGARVFEPHPMPDSNT